MKSTVCPNCHKEITIEGVAFCPYCGASLSAKPKKEEVPAEAQKGLSEIARTQDVKKKNQKMDELLRLFPDCLAVNEEKLFLVRVMDFKARTLDFSVIKSYLLNLYLTPEAFSLEKQKALREELFSHPQLRRCLELAPDKPAYLRHYLERLCTEFVSLFLHSSSTYNHSFFGFHSEHNMEKKLAAPVYTMMSRIYRDAELSEEQREELYRAMRYGLKTDTGSTASLDQLLEENGFPVPIL